MEKQQIADKITVQTITKITTLLHNQFDDDILKCKLIIAGSRDIFSHQLETIITDSLAAHKITPILVLSGGAKGVDLKGEEWANSRHIPVKGFPARWGVYGKIAGHMRNNEMAELTDVLLLIWDGQSSGSAQMKKAALQRYVPVIEVVVEYENKDYLITTNTKISTAIKNRIEINDGHCPCVPDKDDDHLCPCVKMRTSGACCCGLYVES